MSDKKRSKKMSKLEKRFQKKRRALYRKWYKENPELQREAKRVSQKLLKKGYKRIFPETDNFMYEKILSPCGVIIEIQLPHNNCPCYPKEI